MMISAFNLTLNGQHAARRPLPTARSVQQDTTSAGRSLAALRARHHKIAEPKYLDAFSQHFFTEADQSLPEDIQLDGFDDLATAFLDQQLLDAVDLVDMQLQQEVRQVVLLGAGLDTRPFRLPWPGGTVLFEVAPEEAHALAAVRLKAVGVHVPYACLLRRVGAGQLGQPGSEGFAQGLARAGLRGDRLSAWALQGLPALGLDRAAMRLVLAHVAACAAFGSTVAGEMPAMLRSEAEDLIAEAGLLGRLQSLAQVLQEGNAVHGAGAAGEEAPQRWLFVARCQHRSEAEMDMYAAHVEAMEEAGEDLPGDNFS